MRFLLILPLAAALLGGEAAPAAQEKGGGEPTPNLDIDLKAFTRHEPPAPEVLARFLAARAVFAARPDAAYADLAADPAFASLAAEQRLLHLGGPMLGGIAPDGATVWVRTVRPAQVTVRVQGVDRPFGPVASTPASDLSAAVAVGGLQPGRTYAYQVLVDGQPIAMPPHAVIRTPRSDAMTRIAFGTCPHRWGLGNARQSARIRSRNPAALLLGGDIAVQDRANHLGLHRSDYLMRDSFAAWRDLVCAVPVYAAWDDHDYFGNDLAGIPPGHTEADRRGVREVWRTAWANPAHGEQDQGIHFRTRIGPCDVIMLDTRSLRERGSFLGEAQYGWLEQQLAACTGPFIILASGTMWSDHVSSGKDSWGRVDPKGRERIFAFIERQRIPGVLLISGDRHGARGFRIPRPGGHVFYEFEPASLGGRTGPSATSPAWKDVQLFGLDDTYAFGEFEIDPVPADPTVTFRLIHEDGTVLHDLRLTRSQLTPR